MPESRKDPPSETRLREVRSADALMRDPGEDWRVLGDTFEALGKAGLAMTVGFSVAAAFCKMVDSGKIKLPNLIQMLASAQQPDEKQS